jgi:hypothetical protein
MRIGRLFLLAPALFAFASSTTATAKTDAVGFSASVGAPPEVQRLGRAYYVVINVRRIARPIRNFCIDFEDAGNSWLIRMPGLRAYDDDVFCYGTLRPPRKQFVARIVPAKAGQKKLEIGVGAATLYPRVNNAVLGERSLWWSANFVLI